jgi:SAM-dependent methyltransferase/alpha/beta superfamily hydrolase
MIATDPAVSIQSELVIFPGMTGLKIAAFIDYLGDPHKAAGYVVMAPKYGETKKNNLQLAYYLANNGLVVLRFDHTNHIGESDGEITDFTFPGACGDMRASIDYLQRRFATPNVILIANSLSVRPAIRAFSEDHRISVLISVVGVVNFRETVRIVYQRDLVNDHLTGVHHGVTDILGHQVHVAHFMDSCIAEKMHDYAGTIRDIEAAKGRVFFFYADKDAWVEASDVRTLAEACPRVDVQEIRGAMHELRENPEGAERALKEIVYVARHGRMAVNGELETLKLPEKKIYLGQNRLERDRLRLADPIKESEREFWQTYLGKYDIMEKVDDYQSYLDLIGDCLGRITDGEIIFDVGCGNGLFGVWCLRDILARSRGPHEIRPVYFGLDLTQKGLLEALKKHRDSRYTPHPGARFEGSPDLDMIYTPFDLEGVKPNENPAMRLPFADGTFDKICCSLLISYLTDPPQLVAELYRVLRPGGAIVMSSMKPFCDLSQIYKEFVVEEKPEDDIERARNLISAAGAIRTKEEQGHYTFYSREELVALMDMAGFRGAQAFRSFGDQANLVSAHK